MLRSQTQGIVARAEDAINKFVAFCKRIGGDAKVEEDVLFYRATCVLPSPKRLRAKLREGLGLTILSEKEYEQFRIMPDSNWLSIVAYTRDPNDVIMASDTDINFEKDMSSGGVAGIFTRMRLEVQKHGKIINLWLGR